MQIHSEIHLCLIYSDLCISVTVFRLPTGTCVSLLCITLISQRFSIYNTEIAYQTQTIMTFSVDCSFRSETVRDEMDLIFIRTSSKFK